MGPYEAALIEQHRIRRARLINGISVKPPPIEPEPVRQIEVVTLPGCWPIDLGYKSEIKAEEVAPRITVELIMRTVCDAYKVSKNDLISPRRTLNIVRPRQVALWLSRRFTTLSFPQISRKFGNRDHSTCLHAVRKVDLLCATDADFREKVYSVVEILDGVKNGTV